MGTKSVAPHEAPLDAVEQDLAAAELDDIAAAHGGEPWPAWRDIVLRWHCQAVADARAQAWVPGLGGTQDPVVEEALDRFYRHHMRVAVAHLRGENLELRRRLIEAMACIRFYAGGGSDAGARAQRALAPLGGPLTAAGAAAPAAKSH
jgi:hypothetical protein